jgi:hypothetical protein
MIHTKNGVGFGFLASFLEAVTCSSRSQAPHSATYKPYNVSHPQSKVNSPRVNTIAIIHEIKIFSTLVFMLFSLRSGLYKPPKHRMRIKRSRLKLRMKLCTDKERMVCKLNYFNKPSLRIYT